LSGLTISFLFFIGRCGISLYLIWYWSFRQIFKAGSNGLYGTSPVERSSDYSGIIGVDNPLVSARQAAFHSGVSDYGHGRRTERTQPDRGFARSGDTVGGGHYFPVVYHRDRIFAEESFKDKTNGVAGRAGSGWRHNFIIHRCFAPAWAAGSRSPYLWAF
jgi:hypothetical protein